MKDENDKRILCIKTNAAIRQGLQESTQEAIGSRVSLEDAIRTAKNAGSTEIKDTTRN